MNEWYYWIHTFQSWSLGEIWCVIRTDTLDVGVRNREEYLSKNREWVQFDENEHIDLKCNTRREAIGRLKLVEGKVKYGTWP